MEKEIDWDEWPVFEIVLVVVVFVAGMGLLWCVG